MAVQRSPITCLTCSSFHRNVYFKLSDRFRFRSPAVSVFLFFDFFFFFGFVWLFTSSRNCARHWTQCGEVGRGGLCCIFKYQSEMQRASVRHLYLKRPTRMCVIIGCGGGNSGRRQRTHVFYFFLMSSSVALQRMIN